MTQPSDGIPKAAAKGHFAALDSLRGVSALVVVFYHMNFNSFLYDLQLVRHGYLFVDFFFVLSGFIMFYNYDKIVGSDGFRRFMGTRFFRLYPLHFTMLMVFVAWNLFYALVRGMQTDAAAPTNNDGWLDFALNVFLLNGLGIREPGFNTPSWSISTEFWTYLMFAFVLLVAGKDARKGVLAGVFATIAFGCLAVMLKYVKPLHLGLVDAYSLPRCFYGFFLGSALCALLKQAALLGERAGPLIGAAAQIVAIGVAVSILTLQGGTAFDFLLPVLFAAVIATFVIWPRTRLTSLATSRPLLWLGTHSYSIYMVHFFVIEIFRTVVRVALHTPFENHRYVTSPALGLALDIGSVVLVLLLASLTYRLVEQPGRNFGRRLFKGGRNPRVAATTAEPAPIHK